MVGIVVTFSKVEVDNADAIHFLDDSITLSDANLLNDSLGGSEQYALYEIAFAGQLHLDNDQLSLSSLRLDVYAVVFVLSCVLVALAFQNFDDGYFLSYQNGHESFKHLEVGFVTKYAFDSPVKPDIVTFLCLFLFHTLLLFFLVISLTQT